MKQNSTTSVCTATSSWGGSGNQYVDSFIADLHKQRYAGDLARFGALIWLTYAYDIRFNCKSINMT